MDPNATLAALIDELCSKDGSLQQVVILSEALVDWIARGGFRPQDPRRDT